MSVYVTVHMPATRVHDVEGVKDPVLLPDDSVTMPEGLLPVTVTLQVVDPADWIELGEHESASVAVVFGLVAVIVFESDPVEPLLSVAVTVIENDPVDL